MRVFADFSFNIFQYFTIPSSKKIYPVWQTNVMDKNVLIFTLLITSDQIVFKEYPFLIQ